MILLNVIIFIVTSIVGLYITIIISEKFDLFDYPDKKKIHFVKTPNIGGLAIILLLISSFIIYDYSFELLTIFTLSIVVIVIGFIDDLINFKAITKLLLIAIPVTIFVYSISGVQNLGSFLAYDLNLGNFSFIFAFMCMLLLINAANYMDGIDGLISLLAIISFFGIMLLIPKSDWNSLIPILCFLTIFLLFNLGILPKQFLGDSGSLGIGFLLSSLSIYYTQVLEYINPTVIIWFLAFYVFEFLTINIIRLKNKQNVFKKDLNFIFNILEKKVGKLNTLFLCCILKTFFLFNGFIFNYFKLYDFSILIFIIYFFIYLTIRIKYSFNKL
tara:strand:- start:23 stop:1009 length:987 start_codon:yes stop_codon:yes gene_type:complete